MKRMAPEAPSDAEAADLVRRAVAVGGAHAIKFAQACVNEYALVGHPTFRVAMRDCVERMEALKERIGLVL